jgi:hypothetical protein
VCGVVSVQGQAYLHHAPHLESVSRKGHGAQVTRHVSQIMASMPRRGGGVSTHVCCKYKWEESVAPFSSTNESLCSLVYVHSFASSSLSVSVCVFVPLFNSIKHCPFPPLLSIVVNWFGFCCPCMSCEPWSLNVKTSSPDGHTSVLKRRY